ncbi:MAG: hypothetical protein WC929_07995 [Bacilli bacterium]|jgi:predicted RNase H-like nuclease (RuvC/YqgF family)
MSFLTKEKLAIREAIHAMKWLDQHFKGWGLEKECAILENLCSNYKEKEIQSNHNYLDLQYQLDGAESEIESLRDEIKILKLGEKAANELILRGRAAEERIEELEDDLEIAEVEIERLREELTISNIESLAANDTTVDKDVLKSVLMDIAKVVGKVSIIANCGGDFDPNDCNVNTCEYFYDCVRQKALLQKIEKL